MRESGSAQGDENAQSRFSLNAMGRRRSLRAIVSEKQDARQWLRAVTVCRVVFQPEKMFSSPKACTLSCTSVGEVR